MDPSLIVGSKVRKHILKSLLSAAFGRNVVQGTEAVVPRLILFYGENGAGKSTLVDLCRQSVHEISPIIGKPTASIVVDFDTLRFKTGAVPASVRSLISVIHDAAAGAHERISSQLIPFDRLEKKIEDLGRKYRRLIEMEWPKEAFSGNAGEPASGNDERFTAWIETRIPHADRSLLLSPDQALGSVLVDCLANIALRMPIALCFDGFELLATPLAAWLRESFLPILFRKECNMAVIIAGSSSFVRPFRNSFPEKLLYPVPVAEQPLSRSDIADAATARGMREAAEQAETIERHTAGVPVAVQTVLDFTRLRIPPADLLVEGSEGRIDIALMVKFIADRILQLSDKPMLERLLSLALLYRLDKNIIAQLWSVPMSEVVSNLNAVAGRYPSILQGERMQPAFRNLFRSHLIAESARGSASPLSEFLKKFAATHLEHYTRLLERKQVEITEIAGRYADPTFQSVFLGYFYSNLLASSGQACRVLPGLFVEALHFSGELAARLLDIDKELSPLVSPELASMVDRFRTVLPVAEIFERPILPGKAGEGAALGVLEEHLSSMNDLQQAFYHHLKGRLYLISGKFDKAMAEFEAAIPLFDSAAQGYTMLFGDFFAVGYAFAASGDNRNAVKAFAHAIALDRNVFAAWNECGRAYQALEEHKEAAVAFGEAVRIRSDSVETWYGLGLESSAADEHSRAAEAFARVVQIDAGRMQAWFRLALSLEAMQRYSETRDAAKRAVALAPDNWEAHFVLGRSLAATGSAHEAIESLKKTIALKPDCAAAARALGTQFFAVKSYEEAAASLEKAAELASDDPALWHSIATAWLGALKFDKAVVSSLMATGLSTGFFKAWVTLGEAYRGLKDFGNGCAAFRKAAGINPSDRQIWVSIGDCLRELHNTSEAIDAYLRATETRPDCDGIWFTIGTIFQEQGKHADAVEAYRRSVAIDPKVATVWYHQGCSYAALGFNDDAANCFAKSTELSPDLGDAWFRLGSALAKSNKHSHAIDAFLRAADRLPAQAEVWFQLGRSYLQTGNAQSAVKSFNRCIEQDPGHAGIYHERGLAEESLSRHTDAIASFRKALEHSPERVETLLHLGTCCNTLGNYADAADAFLAVRKLDPDNREVLLPLAETCHALGDFPEAVRLYRAVMEQQPDSEEAHFYCALALHAMGEYDEAFRAYQTVVKKWPNRDQAWYNMGLAYHAVGDYTQAMTAYRQASKLNPESPEVWQQLGMVYSAMEQFGEAILSFRKVISRNPGIYDVWYNLGNAYLFWGEYSEAISSYKKATELRPDDFAAWGCLANAYYATGAFDKSADAAGKALGLKVDEPWIISTLALSKVYTGDPRGAGALFESLVAADPERKEIGRAVTELRKAMVIKPALQGIGELLGKLGVSAAAS